MRWIWALAGLCCVAFGAIGAVLPLIPTVPFLLLAAFCFARSSERLHNWLMTHPTFGPPIEDWHAHGAIRRRIKWYASLSIIAAFALAAILGARPAVLVVQACVLVLVAVFIWTRPEA